MSKKGKNRRRELKKRVKPAKYATRSKPEEYGQEDSNFKLDKDLEINKRILILCEGETEEAYFSGLKNNVLLRDKLSAVHIEIVSPSSKRNPNTHSTLRDNSLKGLVWEAMKRKRKAQREKNPFDEIWIVIDNDERNSYIISNKTKLHASKILNENQLEQFSNYLDSFFLSERHYDEFLKNTLGISNEEAKAIVAVTDKNTSFEDYENPKPKTQFCSGGKFVYGQKKKKNDIDEKDFDINWKDWLKKAYSCRSFELWLILHFEACKNAFIVAKEEEITEENPKNPDNVIHHLWNFAPDFCKGFNKPRLGKIDAYNILKPQPYNQKYETEIEAKAVIDRVNSAIINSFWLRQEMQPELDLQGGKYFEVNPFTDVNYLLSSLLEREVHYGHLGEVIVFDGIQINCQIDLQSSELRVTLVNSSSNRILINNTNVGSFLKLLSVDNNNNHSDVMPSSVSDTVNIPPNDGTPNSFVVQFPSISSEKKHYLIVQNSDRNTFLCIPI